MSDLARLKIVGNKVLCEYPEAKENRSFGGIIMPGAKEKPFSMKVVSVGDVDEINVGDTVFFDQYSGSTVTLDGREYLSLPEKDIYGTIE